MFQHPQAQQACGRCRAALGMGNAWGTGLGPPWVDPTPRHASRGPNPTVGLQHGSQHPAWSGDGGHGHRRAMVRHRQATRLLLRRGRMGKGGFEVAAAALRRQEEREEGAGLRAVVNE